MATGPVYDLPITFRVTSWAALPDADALAAKVKASALWVWLLLVALAYLTYRGIKHGTQK